MRKILSSVLLLGLLSACGGSDHNDVGATPPPVSTTPPPVAATPDVYEAQVAYVVAAQSDTTDAAPLDDQPPTMPENTEPEAVK